jgi:GNAT superfamily N-acetyltransferase
VYAAELALHRLVPRQLLLVRRVVLLELMTESPTLPASAPGTRFAGPHERALLMAFGHPPEEIERRLGRGDRVCVLASSGSLEGYLWLRTGLCEEPDLRTRFRIAPNETWIYDVMVAPALRGRGLYPRLLAGAARLLAAAGIERMLVIVDERNRNSVRAHLACGARPVGRIGAFGVAGFVRVRDERSGSRWLAPGAWYETDTRGGALTTPPAPA